jgi:hypothetical protein
MRLALISTILVALVATDAARAHAPTTAIGRAVEALGTVSVSQDPGAAVSDVEAGGFPQFVGSNPKVAFMPAAALSEIEGGPNAIAAEVAREADLDGTLVILAGAQPGTWSDEIDETRLAELVVAAQARSAGGSPAVLAETLVRSVQAEPKESDPPWGWIGAGLLVLALGALALFDRAVRRRPDQASAAG